MAHIYEVVVSDGVVDRILRQKVTADSGRHAISLAAFYCRRGEVPIKAMKMDSPKPGSSTKEEKTFVGETLFPQYWGHPGKAPALTV